MYGLVQTSAPASEPLSVAEAKAHLRVEVSDDDAYIGNLITAARRYVEKASGRQLVTATWQATYDRFPRSQNSYAGDSGCVTDRPIPQPELQVRRWLDHISIRLPRSPLQSVSSITYIDATGATQTLSPSLYNVDSISDPGRVAPVWGSYWPITRRQLNAITITFVAGYGAASAVPETYRLAIRQLVAHWYTNREAVATGNPTTLPVGILDLIGVEDTGEYY